MNVDREKIERQMVVMERMRSLMVDLAIEHREKDNQDAARHCAGVAEGLSIATVSLRCILEGWDEEPVDGYPVLGVVS